VSLTFPSGIAPAPVLLPPTKDESSALSQFMPRGFAGVRAARRPHAGRRFVACSKKPLRRDRIVERFDW